MILDFISFWKTHKNLMIILFSVLLVSVAVVIWIIKGVKKKERISIQRISTIGLFSALSIILYIYDFPLPFFPGFLKINFSALPIIIIAFILGPSDAITVCIIRAILKFAFKGSMTAGVGELMDFIISSSVVLVASYIYKKNRSMKGAGFALIFGAITWVVVALLANWLIIVPLYILLLYDGPDKIINMLSKVLNNVTEDNYMWKYILLSALPFNLLIATVISFITFFVYKPLSFLFDRFDNRIDDDYIEEKNIKL